MGPKKRLEAPRECCSYAGDAGRGVWRGARGRAVSRALRMRPCRMADGDVRYACRLRSSARRQHREPQHGAPVGKALVWAPRQGCKVGEQIKCDLGTWAFPHPSTQPSLLLHPPRPPTGKPGIAHCHQSDIPPHPPSPNRPTQLTPPIQRSNPRHRHHLSTITAIQRAALSQSNTKPRFQTTTCIDAPRGSPLVLF
jgi:hypothetical protein